MKAARFSLSHLVFDRFFQCGECHFVHLDIALTALKLHPVLFSMSYIHASLVGLSHECTKESPCTLADLGWRDAVYMPSLSVLLSSLADGMLASLQSSASTLGV